MSEERVYNLSDLYIGLVENKSQQSTGYQFLTKAEKKNTELINYIMSQSRGHNKFYDCYYSLRDISVLLDGLKEENPYGIRLSKTQSWNDFLNEREFLKDKLPLEGSFTTPELQELESIINELMAINLAVNYVDELNDNINIDNHPENE